MLTYNSLKNWLVNYAALTFLQLTILLLPLANLALSDEIAASQNLQVGIYAQNINPKQLPVWVNGNIAGVQTERIVDPLHARCIVLKQGETTLALCVVDNCILPVELVDKARELAAAKSGIPVSHILISATHTHSAVSVAGVHGTPVQEDYAESLPHWIAEGITTATQRMVPAQLGWGKTIAEKYIHCRRWLMKPGSLSATPFTGRDGDDVIMNPGYDNPNKLAPVGPIDRTIPILSIQTREGKPLAVLASFSTHYAGSPALSADYFGVVANRLARELRPDAPEQFLGVMANATSGDANCIDFSQPPQKFTHVDVGNYVAEQILAALPTIQYSSQITLDSIFDTLTVAARKPSAAEVLEAENYIRSHFPDRLPKTLVENYARETVLLSQLPDTRPLRLQVLRIGSGVIIANPCEAYGETGLKLRRASPYPVTMNIGLANGHAGYIPPLAHFELGGYTTWRARTSCLEEGAESMMVTKLTELVTEIQIRDEQPKPIAEGNANNTTQPPPSPIAPRDSLRYLEVLDDWQVELVAHEPQVKDPVAMQIDEQGRLWVIEMSDYPKGPGPNSPPLGRLVILEDKDGDLFYETSSVFANELLFATGLQLWKDGALVTMSGSLLWLRDTDGNGQADKREMLLQGFQEQNPQLRANDPTIAWDGQLYVANGLRGGTIQYRDSSDRLQLANYDLRVNLLKDTVQLVTGPSQFGMTWDKNGNRYFCANRQPCREIQLEPYQLALSPVSNITSAVRDASPSEAGSRVRPLVNAWTTSNLHAGQFTAACGVLISHSAQFSGRGWGHVLTCEPTGSLVQCRSLERLNGQTNVTDLPPNHDWLASRDPWFRPVNLYEGPAGEIYVMDMYRAVIEHPEWVPEELKNRPDERLGDNAGRIYRLVRNKDLHEKTWKQLRAQANKKQTDDALIEQLNSTSAWSRNTAARLLLQSSESSYPNQNNQLQHLLASSASPDAKLLSLGLLSVRGELNDNSLAIALSDPNASVRTATWRLMADYATLLPISNLQPQLLKSLSSTDRDEVRAACWALAHQPESDDQTSIQIGNLALPILAKQLSACHGDGVTIMAISAAVQKINPAWLDAFFTITLPELSKQQLDNNSENNLQTAISVGFELAMAQDPKTTEQLLDKHLALLFDTSATPTNTGLLLAAVTGFINGKGQLEAAQSSQLADTCSSLIADETSTELLRIQALKLLAKIDPSAAQEIATALLKSQELRLVRTAIQLLQVNDSPEVANLLISHFAAAPPPLRADFLSAIRSKPNRLALLFTELENKRLSPQLIELSQRNAILASVGGDEKAKWQRILGGDISADREAIISKYRSALTTKTDEARGKLLFTQHCAACHRIDEVGTSVGPDISDSREQSFDKLLIAILDPNRSIDANYFRYVASTNDGEIVEGLLSESSAKQVVLKGQNGVLHTITTEELQGLKVSETSMMPVGFESQVTPEQMNDLLSYIKNWRYLKDGIPGKAAFTPNK